MPKFFAFLLSAVVLSTPFAKAQSTENQDNNKEEEFGQILVDAGLESFHALKEMNDKCVDRAVNSTVLLLTVPGFLSLGTGSYLGKARQLKEIRKYVDEVIASDMHSLNKLNELSKAGKQSAEALKFNRGSGARFFSKTGLTLLAMGVMERIYYSQTGDDLLTRASLNEFVLWARTKLSIAMTTKDLAAYYTTKSGFREFLRLENQDQVKELMSTNSTLAAGTVAIAQLAAATSCGVINLVAPDGLDQKSKDRLSHEAPPIVRPKGETL